MLSFKKFIQLNEHVLSIGLNPSHEKYREEHRNEIHDLLRNSYNKIGGYSGFKSGSDEESKAIHKDIDSSIIKAVRRPTENGKKITAVNLYKRAHGRKSIAVGTDGSEQGKKDFYKTKIEDNEHKRAWAEVSGALEHIQNKIGFPSIPFEQARKLVGKSDMRQVGDNHYERKIGGHVHKKVAVGYPK